MYSVIFSVYSVETYNFSASSLLLIGFPNVRFSVYSFFKGHQLDGAQFIIDLRLYDIE